MKSIKRGRGPSFMEGFGSIIGFFFAIFWTAMAAKMGAPLPFCLFGVLFMVATLVSAVYSFMNATGKKRFSEFDVVDHTEEADPLNERFGNIANEVKNDAEVGESKFCPYCGAPAEAGFEFCNQCGKKLP